MNSIFSACRVSFADKRQLPVHPAIRLLRNAQRAEHTFLCIGALEHDVAISVFTTACAGWIGFVPSDSGLGVSRKITRTSI